MLGRETAIPFSAEAMKASLLRLQNEWEAVQASRERNAIYQYLTAVFETVIAWAKEGKAVKRASFVALPILKRSMIGRGTNGRGFCGTRHNTRTWMSLWVVSSSAGAV